SKIARDIADRRRVERVRDELVERLAFLSEVGTLLASSLDYEQTLDRAVHLALPRLGDYCNVLVEDEHGQLRHVAWGHVDRSKEAMLGDLARLLIESSDASMVPTLADRVMATGKTTVIGH